MEIVMGEKEGILLLELSGQLVAGEPASRLRAAVEEAISSGRNRLILNMAGVDYVDSSGLGALVMAFTTARKEGGTVKLLNLSRRNIELIVLTKLETVFEVFDDEQSAVNSFFPGREIQKFDILSFLKQRKAEE